MRRNIGKFRALILFLVLCCVSGRTIFSQVVPDCLFMISLRKELTDSKKLCEEPWVSFVGVSDPFLTDSTENLPDSVLIQAVRGKKALVVIHGMGISFLKVKKHYDRVLHWTQQENDPIPYDIVIGVTWPGLELSPSKLSFGVIFLKSNPKARRSGKKLATMLDTLSQTAASLDILTHSMGSKVALVAMKEERVGVAHLFLMGPSIDAKVFQKNKNTDLSQKRSGMK
ncbi:MAG: alpha/beta hydrolase [Saprospirales bacterium]|nr:alpha/beta hydrolase [Saprospirales bacterium]